MSACTPDTWTPLRVARPACEIYSESLGEPTDPPVLLVMGAMASGLWWPDGLCRRLTARRRFILRYDHRDTGASTQGVPGEVAYDVEDLADDAMAVLDAHGIARAHLCGMSLGGYLVQLAALKWPTRVETLTLIATERLADDRTTPPARRPADDRTAPGEPELPSMSPELLEYHAAAVSLDWTDREAVLDYQVGAWRLLGGSGHAFDAAGIRALAAADYDRTPNPLTAMNHALLGGGTPGSTGWTRSGSRP